MKRRLAGILIMLAVVTSILACNIGSSASAVPQGSKSTQAPPATQPPATQPLPGITAPDSPDPTSTQVLASPTPTLGTGSTKQSASDGMIQVFVPAGEFIMGSDNYDSIM